MPKAQGKSKGKSRAPAQAGAAATPRIKKKNYSENEIEALLSGVERKKRIIFASTTSGIHNPDKAAAWKFITTNVNAVSAVQR